MRAGASRTIRGMFIAIPLENKPTWKSPPWMTVLLIVINCLVFWVWQGGEERAAERAAKVYARTDLPAIEVPAFLDYLSAQSKEKDSRISKHMLQFAQGLNKSHNYEQLYNLMWQEGRFRSQLIAGDVIRTNDLNYADWKAARARFASQEPPPFTTRWAMSYEPGAGWQPVQALTSTFMHGSTGHLVGNMVFLFLFGFTLEMALGAGRYLLFYLVCGVSASLFAGLFYAGMGSYGLGASGAIAGLMAMYVVLYRMRRIRFFYMLAFYFNYAMWPALVLLPVWMAFELVQHMMGGRGVAYMAHFGGLLAGGLLMALYLQLRKKESVVEVAARDKDKAQAQTDALQAAVQRAQQYTDALAFDRAARAWRQAAKLAPTDTKLLRAWFESARHAPASDDFHQAARAIFKLPAKTDADRQLQHHSWRTYCERAQPVPRISDNSLHALALSFARLGEWGDAQKLCQQLEKTADHPQWPTTLALVANGLAKAGRVDDARRWLPALQHAAPQDPITRWLASGAR